MGTTADDKAGPLELTFDDESTMFFDAAGNGEELELRSKRWEDPFKEPLSTENKKFVEGSGKWTAFDVSNKPPFSRLIYKEVIGVELIENRERKVVGVHFLLADGTIRVGVQADELYVDVA
ncbi:hypothetical protein [Amycolatopsis pithecellobii]|uniref:Uncharacterized protein n=1 Tax=Amycolatopsis pithecellobii TaxID=664692 RepID=A0A6N7Z460_9PSEU|nr:hypothetical protein [Amycolatopsis pithecellobii]MTD56089.1 hypothetical protein [Amycolatopsis pithecellobii]